MGRLKSTRIQEGVSINVKVKRLNLFWMKIFITMKIMKKIKRGSPDYKKYRDLVSRSDVVDYLYLSLVEILNLPL